MAHHHNVIRDPGVWAQWGYCIIITRLRVWHAIDIKCYHCFI